jgi:proteasome accessory factor C
MNARFSAPARLARLLAIIPHVAGRGFVALDELAARFSYPADELAADLGDVLPYVGVAPFTPDTLIEVTFDEDHVRIDYADWFARPLRLAPAEALALLAAGRTILAVEPDDDASGPLLRGLTKLGAAIGAGGDGTVEIHVGATAEATLALLRTAVGEHRQVRLDYYSYGRDRRTVRTVEPRRFFVDEGNWYVGGYCQLAQADRVFRVDRIRAAELLDAVFVAPAGAAAPSAFEPGPDDPRAVLELEPAAAWVAAQYPNDGVEQLDGGRVRVVLPVTARAWLERLLVRLGPAATVVRMPAGYGDDVRAQAARRILARYRAADAGTGEPPGAVRVQSARPPTMQRPE